MSGCKTLLLIVAVSDCRGNQRSFVYHCVSDFSVSSPGLRHIFLMSA